MGITRLKPTLYASRRITLLMKAEDGKIYKWCDVTYGTGVFETDYLRFDQYRLWTYTMHYSSWNIINEIYHIYLENIFEIHKT